MNIVKTSFKFHRIVILVVTVLMICGVYALKFINKNEFPDCTVRQGIVVAVCPGATAEQVEQEVTKRMEDYIFTYRDVDKKKTTSASMSGMSVVQVQLNDEIDNKEEFWAKFKHGVNEFKGQLPKGVVAVVVLDDFGDSSALLITMESDDKTYRQLADYMDALKDRLRTVEAVGRMTVTGMQRDQVSITLDNDRLSQYGLSDQTLAVMLFSKGFTTTAGRIKDADSEQPIYVNRSEASVPDIEEMIVLSTPTGDVVRLKDVADIRREYPAPDSYITNNGHKCLLLSVEMKKGKDIVAMGEAVKRQIAEFEETLPKDITLYNITDQSKVVDDAVKKFLSELAIAVIAVIVVVMLLLPLRTALVAAGTIPITIFISLGLFMACGLELNCITLCVLILSLGMVVDNSIVIIDSYLEKLEHLRLAADSLQTVLRSWPELRMVRTNLNEPRPTSHIALHEDRSTRMGLTNFGIESTLAMRYGSGLPVASVYEGDYEVPVVIKSNRADSATTGHLTDEQIPVVGGLGHLPLRQVADIEPQWEMGSIPHRNGVRCVTVSAEFDRSQRVNGIAEKEKVERMIRERGAQFLPSDVSISYGGDFEESDDNMLFILTIIPVAYYGLTPNPSPNGEGSR